MVLPGFYLALAAPNILNRKLPSQSALFMRMASLEGFEPTTRCLEGSRSVHLSYRDIYNLLKFSTGLKARSRLA
jgi:hypothetical protein